MSWGTAPDPKLWVDDPVFGFLIKGADGNNLLGQQAYLAGRQLSASGTFVEVTGETGPGGTLVPVKARAFDLPAGTVLYFVHAAPGNAVPVYLPFAVPAGPAESIPVQALGAGLEVGDRAPFPAQTVVELDAALQVPAIGAVAEQPRLGYKNRFFSGSGSLFTLIAQHLTANGTADRQDIEFAFKPASGDPVVLGRIRARRDGTSTTASLDFTTATGGVLNATPGMTARHTRRVCIGGAAGNFTLDLEGAGPIDLEASGRYIGIDLWRERPPGTLSHTGDAAVTGRLRSTLADGGDPPLVLAANSGLIRGLNCPKLGATERTWPAAALEDDGSDTIDDPFDPLDPVATTYPLATVTAPELGLFVAISSAVIEIDTGDEGALFSAVLTGALRNPAIKLPSVGMKSQVINFSLLSLAAAATATGSVTKNAGTGNSPATGGACMLRYGVNP